MLSCRRTTGVKTLLSSSWMPSKPATMKMRAGSATSNARRSRLQAAAPMLRINVAKPAKLTPVT